MVERPQDRHSHHYLHDLLIDCGMGVHSPGGVSRLRPAVWEFLESLGLRVVEARYRFRVPSD
eukprot:12667289-Alexandrium_andersonii.AAC.1